MLTQLFYNPERALRGFVDLLFDHYELPLYHPGLSYEVKRKLWRWAKTQDLGDIAQGYLDGKIQALTIKSQIPVVIDNVVITSWVQKK